MIAAVPVAWLVARAAGLVALGLLTISVTLGLALSTKLLGNRRGKALLGWHQTLMWTALAMVSLHGVALALDPVLRFGISALLVPGVAGWRTVPVAGGIVAGWLMLALASSYHVRRRIGQRRWRMLHYASFAAFVFGLYHALNVGTDLTGTRGLIVAGVAAAPVCWLVFARILIPRPAPRPPRSTGRDAATPATTTGTSGPDRRRDPVPA